ncbi:heme-dependent catalase [Coniochaeta ligniaria NRRL 30616]|uniref:Heme-dependent catalase n=1 Tax=Coniochaeta ligniaria NRRL 30616 TaxID=1408157 RepID=A0A1J7JFI8_9PEZI|nr:heme-dependent catalase [Coniochaeta ligniaria NRRL 30616]
MPLSVDSAVAKTGEDLVHTLKDIFHPPPGFRPVHAKGILLTGSFVPTPSASLLSVAPHFTLPSVPILARFSSSTGIPALPDSDPNGNPRGLALRFHLPDTNGRRAHTDIIAHSVDAFPGKDGAEALAFFTAVREGKVPEFLGAPENENARTFVFAPKPTPRGLETETYFAVNAFVLVGKDGKKTNVRYRVVPDKGVSVLTDEEAKGKGPDFLYEGLKETVGKGPVSFKLVVQVGEEGDVTSDNTKKWPEERKTVELGTVTLDEVVEDDPVAAAKKVIFDPIPRVDGVEPSDDPLLEVRAHAYLVSGRERRAA